MNAQVDPQERAWQFARWGNRVVHEAMAARGLGKVKTIALTGVSRSTVDRWLNGDISKGEPKIRTVTQFCQALDADLGEPYRIMGWNLNDAPRADEATRVLPPEVKELLRYMDGLSPARVQQIRMRLRFLLLEQRALDGEPTESTEDGAG